jgi:uncharacterized protein YqeY
MKDIKSKLNEMLKEALKNKDQAKLNVIKLLKTSITNEEIKTGQKELNEDQIISVINREVKKRKEAIEEFKKVGKLERAEEEEKELNILLEFLPKQLTIEEIDKLIDNAINQTGAQSAKDIGKVMGFLMKEIKGKADGKLVNELVLKKLSK